MISVWLTSGDGTPQSASERVGCSQKDCLRLFPGPARGVIIDRARQSRARINSRNLGEIQSRSSSRTYDHQRIRAERRSGSRASCHLPSPTERRGHRDVGQALQELPKRLADPLIAKINTQLQAQAPKPPAEPGKDDKVAPSKEKAK